MRLFLTAFLFSAFSFATENYSCVPFKVINEKPMAIGAFSYDASNGYWNTSITIADQKVLIGCTSAERAPAKIKSQLNTEAFFACFVADENEEMLAVAIEGSYSTWHGLKWTAKRAQGDVQEILINCRKSP